ncbi:MAG: hypothetical protein ABSF35_17565 [Polyangia bacterium]
MSLNDFWWLQPAPLPSKTPRNCQRPAALHAAGFFSGMEDAAAATAWQEHGA